MHKCTQATLNLSTHVYITQLLRSFFIPASASTNSHLSPYRHHMLSMNAVQSELALTICAARAKELQNDALANGLYVVRQSSKMKYDGTMGTALSFLLFNGGLVCKHVDIKEERDPTTGKYCYLAFSNPIPGDHTKKFPTIGSLIEVSCL